MISTSKLCLVPSNLLFSNRLLDSLSKSGRLADARNLFDQMPHRDSFTYNTLISAYANSGQLPDALRLFAASPYLLESTVPWSSLISAYARLPSAANSALLLFNQMLSVSLRPDPYSLCAALRARGPHQSFHALALKTALSSDPFVAAAHVSAYADSGQLPDARQVFDSVPSSARLHRVLWTTLLAAEVRAGDSRGALDRFRLMRKAGLEPNRFTLPPVLAACAAESDLALGRQVHASAVRAGFASSRFVVSSLVGLYAKCSDVESARKVLDSAESDDSVSWNAIVVSSSRRGLHSDALTLFVEMHRRGIAMDEFTYPSALNSAAGGRADTGRAVHCLVVKTGFEDYRHVANALVDFYAKCGSVGCARGIFDRMPEPDVVTWTALFLGYARHVSNESALRLYLEMRLAGVEPDEFVVAGALSCSAGLTVLGFGRQIHTVAVRFGFDSFRSVGNALVSMYAKSGSIDDAERAFDSMNRRDPITWTALIVGYAQNGRGRESLRIYDHMLQTGFRPDYVTFIGLLFACSHAGLVEAGRAHFESMEAVYEIRPGPEHYACMIDLLGRSGRTQEAVGFLNRMETKPDATIWKALLAACRVHRDVELAERAAEMLFELEPGDAVPYILLSNLYSAAGRWSDVARIRWLMKARGVSKEGGCSWMEAERGVHVFHVEDRGHPRAAEIYAKMGEMMGRIRDAGYVADRGWALQDVAEEAKEAGLACHSEKLAVAFGLLSAPSGAAIRVFKNLRVCGDCHAAIKLVAKVYGREIVVRDSNCFHHFSEGFCSCGDYW